MEYNIKSLVIGLDLGGTNSVFGIVDGDGEIIATTSIKTQTFQRVEQYVEESVKAVMQIVEQVGGMEKIRALGIGAPCGNYYKGTIENAANLVWAKGIVPLADMFAEKLGIPVAITNDANAAAMGEMKYGAAVGMKNFVELTLGTGVGSGIVANGQLIYGCDGFAGELGHMIVETDGRPCGCGRKGCLEQYTSATGIVRMANTLLNTTDRPSALRNVQYVSAKEVFDAAKQGDELAAEIVDRHGKCLGKALAQIACVVDPEVFVIGGGVSKAGTIITDTTEKYFKEYAFHACKNTKFTLATLGNDAGMYGGACAIMND